MVKYTIIIRSFQFEIVKRAMTQKIFAGDKKKDVTRAIASEFPRRFEEYLESDCIIVGRGPAGLTAGIILSSKEPRASARGIQG